MLHRHRCFVLTTILCVFAGQAAADPEPEISFGPLGLLNSRAELLTGDDVNPNVVVDAAGNLVALWSTDDAEILGVTDAEGILCSVSTDGGITWSSPAIVHAPLSSGSTNHHPAVATNGAGTLVAIWITSDLGGTREVAVSRSTNLCAGFGAASLIGNNPVSATGSGDFAALGAAGQTMVAVWPSNDDAGGTIGTDDDIYVSRSTDAGASWSDPVPLASDAADPAFEQNDHPALLSDGAGNWVIAWDRRSNLLGSLPSGWHLFTVTSSDDGVTWAAPLPVDPAPAGLTHLNFEADLAHDGAGNWVMVWQSFGHSGNDYDIRVARSTNQGVSWTTPAFINTHVDSLDNDRLVSIATDGAGVWVAAWEGAPWACCGFANETDLFFSCSMDAGATWSSEQLSHPSALTDVGFDHFTDLVEVGGNWVLFSSSDNGFGGAVSQDFDIAVQRSVNGGISFSFAAAVNDYADDDPGDDLAPAIARREGGEWIAVWSSRDTLGGSVGQDTDIHFARSHDGGASWSAAAALSSTALTDSGEDVAPDVGVDALGNWVAIWEATEAPGESPPDPDADVLVSRSSDGGATWTTPAALNDGAASDVGDDTDPKLATDAAGTWVAVWTSTRSNPGGLGTDEDILTARSLDAGATWSPAAALNSAATGDASDDADREARIEVDALGNWVVGWQAGESTLATVLTNPDVLYARSTDGGQNWSPQALLSTSPVSANNDSLSVDFAADAAGNWVGVFVSDANIGGATGFDSDILFVNSSDGGSTWSAPQTLNSTATVADGRVDFAPRIDTDGAGHWVVAWYSSEIAGSLGLDRDAHFAQSDDGTTWTPIEALNSNADSDTGEEGALALVTDGRGTWLSVWTTEDDLLGTVGTDWDLGFALAFGPDRDGDDLSDGEEVNRYGTDPDLADSDGDFLWDGVEVLIHGTDPLDIDTDDDGFDDRIEINAGSDPLDPGSVPGLAQVPSLSPLALGILIGLLAIAATFPRSIRVAPPA